MNTLEIRSGNPSESEWVAIVMAVQALTMGATETQLKEPQSSSCWALSGPLNTQRRATLNAPGSPWQRSGHLTELW